jgi:hypothetical protein
MIQEVGQLAAATTQVRLFPYDEEEPAIWFRLIEAQFATADIIAKAQICMPMLLQPAKASPLGHSGYI